MVGKLTIEKASMNVSYFLASIQILHDAGGHLSRKKFIARMAAYMGCPAVLPNGKENRVPYNKTKFPRYFGFIDVNDEGALLLTARGQRIVSFIEEDITADPNERYSFAEDAHRVIPELFLESIVFDSFGKNNSGAEQSQSDVEPPKVILKAISDLNGATKDEIGFVLWGLDVSAFSSYDDAIEKVLVNRDDPTCDYSELFSNWEKQNFVSDFKLLELLTEPGIDLVAYDEIEEKYVLSENLTAVDKNRIGMLSPVYLPLQIIVSGSNVCSETTDWVLRGVLGRYGDGSFVVSYDYANYTEATWHVSLAEALVKAFDETRRNISLVITNLDTSGKEALLGPLSDCFGRVQDVLADNHGDSVFGVVNLNLAHKIKAACSKCDKWVHDGVVKFPTNFNVIGVNSMPNAEPVNVMNFVNVFVDNGHPPRDIKMLGGPLQRISYGAPGTGKSKGVNDVVSQMPMEDVVRTTFHPDSDYSTFVGAYKPKMECLPRTMMKGEKIEKIIQGDADLLVEKKITYEFVPQAFAKAYVQAWKRMAKPVDEKVLPVMLVVEEINRGECAKIFGDLFQLLDRRVADDDQDPNDAAKKVGFSEYPVLADSGLADYIRKELSIADVKAVIEAKYPTVIAAENLQLILPPNLYIWATMNTSDQSLFPIDSAFKRRWDWKYVPIREGKHKDGPKKGQKLGWKIDVGGEKYDWWKFLGRINTLIYKTTESEDKKLGYFFVKPDVASMAGGDKDIISADRFVDKVVFYLWNDVFKDYGIETIFKNEQIEKKNDDEDGQAVAFERFFVEDGDKTDPKVLGAFFKALDFKPDTAPTPPAAPAAQATVSASAAE